MSEPPLPVLDVAAVRRRYPWIRDSRTARAIMAEAGPFIVARRLVVRRDDLLAWEDRRRADWRGGGPAAAPGLTRRVPGATAGGREPLPAGWWREPDDGTGPRG
jgi:hypothetical protein